MAKLISKIFLDDDFNIVDVEEATVVRLEYLDGKIVFAKKVEEAE